MTEEQQFKTKALSQGMEALKAEYRNRMDRETDSYHQAVFQLLLNVDETWRAKNEKSWFETALDNIGGHKVVKSTMVSLLEELETKLVEALQVGAMSMTQIAEIRRKKMKDVSDIKAEIVYVDSFLRKKKLKGVDTDKPVERWKPEMGEKCWYISHNGQIDFFRWNNDIFYTAWYDFGNVFRTEQDAIAAQERIKKAFLG
jgi:hypothetical protein